MVPQPVLTQFPISLRMRGLYLLYSLSSTQQPIGSDLGRSIEKRSTVLGEFTGVLCSTARLYARVETCMFTVKLPQCTSLDVMLERLRYAIHYREDPVSGSDGVYST